MMLLDPQQECPDRPSPLARSETGAALADCRCIPGYVRRIGLPVAFIRMAGEPASCNRATPLEPHRNEMMFERTSPSCYSYEVFAAFMEQSRGGFALAEDAHRAFGKISGVYAEVCKTAEWIVTTTPCRLGDGKQADGKTINGMSAGG
jgi:hypothetical protein